MKSILCLLVTSLMANQNPNGVHSLNASEQILEAVLNTFFSDLPPEIRAQIAALLNDGYYGAKHISSAMQLSDSVGQRPSEKKLRLFFDLVFALRSGLNYANGGFDPDVLAEFPAQRLIQVRFDVKEPVDWKTFWSASGGKFHAGEMVALKWDRVWWKISFLNLPVAPFQFGSGYDLEDVDRDEAEELGLIKARDKVPVIKIELDQAELRARLLVALNAYVE